MTQSTQSSSKKRLLYHFFIGNLTRRNKRGRSPPCSSSSSIPVQSLPLTDNNNNPIINQNEQNINRDEISDRIHYYPLTRYYVIVLMSLATIIISSSFILPTCTATAIADPVPIRISHSYTSLKDAAPKQIAKDSSESSYKIKISNKNSNYANNSSNNANSQLTSFSQPFYTRLSVQENAFRPSYLYATKTIAASTTSRAALLRDESTTTTDPVTNTNKRLSHDPFFNFVNNFQSLTSTESSSLIDRSSSNTANNDQLPTTQLQSQKAKSNRKKSRKRTRQDDDGPFAFPLPNPIVVTSTTSKPTLHPLLVLETEMRTTTTTTASPIKDESSIDHPSVSTEDITQPNSGPYPDSARANSGQQNGPPPGGMLTFEEYEKQRKSKNKPTRNKPSATTSTEDYINNHNSGGFSPSSGVVVNGGDAKRLRSNFFDNFHDTDVDNIAEESGGAPEVTIADNENTDNGAGNHNVNIPAGYSYAKKQNPTEEFHYSEATNGNNNNNDENNEPQRNPENNHHQYQLKPSFHFPSNNYHSGPFQLPQPTHRFPPKPVSKLRPNLQSYYDDSYHKFTAAAENQYENHGNSYGNRPPLHPPSPNYPPLPHLPRPIAIPMSAFPSPHHAHQHQHQPPPPHPHMRPHIHHLGHGHHRPPHHRHNNHGSHYYGNNFPTGPSTPQPIDLTSGLSNLNPSGLGDNSIEVNNQQQNDAQNQQSEINPGTVLIPTAAVTQFSPPTYGIELAESEPGIHTNKKVGIMDTFEIFYKEYKILTWAVFLIVTSLALLSLVVFLYVNNPPTEVVTARNQLQEMLTSPQLIRFLTNLIDGGKKSRRKSLRDGKNRWKFSATQEPKKDL